MKPAGKPEAHPAKKPKKLNLRRWKGRCRESFQKLGYASVDAFIEDVRGR